VCNAVAAFWWGPCWTLDSSSDFSKCMSPPFSALTPFLIPSCLFAQRVSLSLLWPCFFGWKTPPNYFCIANLHTSSFLFPPHLFGLGLKLKFSLFFPYPLFFFFSRDDYKFPFPPPIAWPPPRVFCCLNTVKLLWSRFSLLIFLSAPFPRR